MDFVETAVDLDRLLLDPNNFRFQERDDFVYADKARFHEQGVQARAYQQLRQANDLRTLKASIVKNTYISSERIIVSKYSEDPERYLVIEGNRRVAAARWIQEDFAAGVAISEDVLQSISPFPVLLLENEGEDADIIRTSMMGIRHISGIKKWGGYQEAKLLVHLRD